MLEAANDPRSVCAVLGRSLFALRKVGQKLTVDRIDSTKGYVDGNMQLLASDLNSAKGVSMEVPWRSVHLILRRLERVVDDRLSRVPGATHRA